MANIYVQLVIEIQCRVIDDGAEWRFYGVDDNRSEDPTRCGMPTNNTFFNSPICELNTY